MDVFTIIQCHYCLEWASHTRPNCPFKDIKPQACAKCGEGGHKHTECSHPVKCINCDGEHPATARCCPVYKSSLQYARTKLAQEILHANGINSHQEETSSDTENDKNSHMTELLAEAAHTSSSMEEFNTRLFNACKNLSYTSPQTDSSQEEPELNKPILDMPPTDLSINELETEPAIKTPAKTVTETAETDDEAVPEPANKTPAKTVTEMVKTDVDAVLEVEADEND
ncbi:unnamed protein product, partial [Meganyctiphanes norvegica]